MAHAGLNHVFRLPATELKGVGSAASTILKRLMNENKVLIIFDGVCNLCEGAVHFAHARDVKGDILYGFAQEEKTHAVVALFGLKPADLLQSVVLVESTATHDELVAYRGSTAALRTMMRFPFPWSLLARIGLWVPVIIRDCAYRLIARNRYYLFGQKEYCGRPSPTLKAAMVH
jgi:predicted DCC family thiol-disulfide oxidoreductase YuxK